MMNRLLAEPLRHHGQCLVDAKRRRSPWWCRPRAERIVNQFEYLLMFASVILALAVGDVAISLNRLLQAGAKVKWDWLAPLAAAVAFIKIVTQWWSWYGAAGLAAEITFGMFVAVLVGAVLLFLMAAATLPDQVEDAGIDLLRYYEEVHRRFWLLFAAHWIVATGVAIWIEVSLGGERFVLDSPVYLIVPLAVVLAFWWNRWVHTACLVGLLLLYLGHPFRRVLGH
jgi:hypothetical protein